jgi:hypothetical protein
LLAFYVLKFVSFEKLCDLSLVDYLCYFMKIEEFKFD